MTPKLTIRKSAGRCQINVEAESGTGTFNLFPTTQQEEHAIYAILLQNLKDTGYFDR